MPAILLRVSTVSISSVIPPWRDEENIFPDEEKDEENHCTSLPSHSILTEHNVTWHPCILVLFTLRLMRTKKWKRKDSVQVWTNTRKHRGFVKMRTYFLYLLRFQFPEHPVALQNLRVLCSRCFVTAPFIYIMHYRFLFYFYKSIFIISTHLTIYRGDIWYTCNLEIIYIFHHSYVT